MAKKNTAAPAETAPAAAAPGTDVALASPVVRAEQALRFNQTRAHLDLLASKFVTLKSVDTDDNFAAARAAHNELRAARVKLEATGKNARADATAYGKAVIAVERKLIEIIGPEEKRLAGLLEAEQRRRDDIERAAREAAEARVRATEAAFARVRQLPDLASRATTDEAIAALQAEAQKLLDDHSHLPEEFHAAAKYEARIAVNGCKVAQEALEKRRKDEAELEELRRWRAEQEARAAANAAEAARAAAVVAEQSKPAGPPVDDDDLPPGFGEASVASREGYMRAVDTVAEAGVRDDGPPLFHSGGHTSQSGPRAGEVSAIVSTGQSRTIPDSVQVPVARVLPLLQAARAALRLLAQGGYATNPVYLDLAAAIDDADAPGGQR